MLFIYGTAMIGVKIDGISNVCVYRHPRSKMMVTLRDYCNIGYSYAAHPKLISRENVFAKNTHFTSQTVYGSGTTVRCAKFQNAWTNEQLVMGQRDFTRFDFKVRSKRISYIAKHHILIQIVIKNYQAASYC